MEPLYISMPRVYPYFVALSELLTYVLMGNNFINQSTVYLCSFFVFCLTSSIGISLPTTTFTDAVSCIYNTQSHSYSAHSFLLNYFF